MNKHLLLLVALAGMAMSVAGCNVGNAPEPMASSDVQGELAKLPPEKQIDWYNRSPMPPAEKQKKIDEIRAKYGLTGETNVPSTPGGPNIPGGG